MKEYIIILSAIIILILALIPYVSIDKQQKVTINDYAKFRQDFYHSFIPLYKEFSHSYWNASISGNKTDWEKYENATIKINSFFANRTAYEFLTQFKKSDVLSGEVQQRELDIIYLQYKSKQVDKELLNQITKLSSEIEMKFNNYRTFYNGKNLTDNEVLKILENETNSEILKNVWSAQKEIGKVVSSDIIKLAKLRNQMANKLGYSNYHNMSLSLSEQDPNEITSLFQDLDKLTSGFFENLKKEVDKLLSEKYKISQAELMPWHYNDLFFQSAPKVFKSLDYDQYYKDANLEAVTEIFYGTLDLPIDDIIKKSDLYSRKGKSQHAMMLDLDNEGDIRVLSNNVNDSKWMGTMLHEFGHAAYDKFISSGLPWILREPAHIFTTEAIAMLFGRQAYNPNFIYKVTYLNSTELNDLRTNKEAKKKYAFELLVFSRWAQVMYNFEKSMYENPEQDLDKLWWNLVQKYQLLQKPLGRDSKPDWATKIHISIAPCYYHNYLLGELLASQLNNFICHNKTYQDDIINPEYFGQYDAGKYLRDNVFKVGNKYRWDKMILKATGENLTPKYYAKEIELCLK